MRRLVAVLVVAALLVGLLSACSGGDDGGAPTDAQVRAALATHARGVLRHDRDDFLAAVDAGRKAADFRDDQLAEYDNLVTVPLASWSYSLGPQVTDRTAQAAARKAYGASARIVRLELHYAIRGVDTVPVQHNLWWTFVRGGGKARAVGDDSLAREGGVSWSGPWDFGPMTTATGRSSVVFGRADGATSLQAIATVVDTAVPAVTSVWGTGWTRRVAVIVAPSSAALTAAIGASTAEQAGGDISALAVSAGSDPLTNRPLEQRLVIDPAAYAKLSAVGRRITVTHELTHLASAAATTEAIPRWLIEGFADYVGNLGTGQPVGTVAAELRAQIRAGSVPSALPGDDAVDAASTAASAYEQSWLACRLIAARIGQAGLVRFYRTVGASPDSSNVAVAAAVKTLLGESVAGFTAQWRAYLRSQLG
ncbi:hypothetical protein [uncultured Jatrophihabitans sp.]|uniref:hypothetical protein n=1 Tax=uncultured Jatrophihabitans sp. TaxID=1610747 RepID=UPI0035C9EBA1